MQPRKRQTQTQQEEPLHALHAQLNQLNKNSSMELAVIWGTRQNASDLNTVTQTQQPKHSNLNTRSDPNTVT